MVFFIEIVSFWLIQHSDNFNRLTKNANISYMKFIDYSPSCENELTV